MRALLVGIADTSPFLWHLAAGDPDRLTLLASRSPEASLDAVVARQREAWREGDAQAVMGALRRNRAELALLVALADLGGAWTVDEVVAALSAFADASVGAATEFVLREAAATGRFRPADPENPQVGSGLVVLALGKHGAGELNYSSDIDLVVFFDGERAPLAPGLEPTPFFARLAQRLARLLQERTGDGYVHRVDYRLRPDPGSTATALSLVSAYAYYEAMGQNWERAAFIKARPVAGDLPAGEAFLADLRPFIWRKYFDFASIADVHAMKRQIHAVRGHETIAVAGHDIKLGRGGIREIEFFVQTQQLVFGGRRAALRGRGTLEGLGALHDEGWIDAAARDELSAAYRFLRTVEHRLQMVQDEQTQRLPAEPAALRSFARFCGFRTLEAFELALLAHAGRVQAHYALLFEAGSDLSGAGGSLVFTGTESDPETLATLRDLGFRDPERTAETVRGWHFGRRPAVTGARAREVLTDLVPMLLAALAGTPDPDGALAALDRAFARMPAAAELLAILKSNARLRLLFADLLGSAPRLAETVAFSPHVLDAVIDPLFVAPAPSAAEVEVQCRRLVGTPAAIEDFLDRVRDAARQLRFLNGAQMLSGLVSAGQAGVTYAAVAQAVVRLSLEAVTAAFEAEHGAVPGGRVAVLGLGRLGSRELTADSDLDCVVLYDFDPERRESTGPRPLDAVLYYARLTQRLVAALTAPTRRGRLYEVDLRLRPQGRKGPVASHLAGFLAYQDREADLWEHMALTRARPVAGDAGLAGEAMRAIAGLLARPREPQAVARAVTGMRALVAREKGDGGPWDLKLSPGGLTDLDFLAQALVLAHAASEPALVGRPTAEVLALAAERGIVPAASARTLGQAHAVLDTVHHWQRLTVEGAFDERTATPALRARVAAALGLPGEARLLADLGERRREVRRLFEELLGTGPALGRASRKDPGPRGSGS